MRPQRSPRESPPAVFASAARSGFEMRRSRRASRPASDDSTSASVLPKATVSSSFSNDTEGFFSSGRLSERSLSQTPTQSTITKWVLASALGLACCMSVGFATRAPRPFICSK